ncbi:YihY/virulence factor BrkB family protein [Arthrobacter sp. JSM 101049]|uniref:YihY/virulence factor BrkB family protein n=1 Tax=Arthrobacter sp. JSM 101049 TaxID=929097 RepID=UPI00356A3BF3
MSSRSSADRQHQADESAARRGQEPPADDRRKPTAPPQLSGRAWKYILKRTIGEFSRDKCTDLAAALTYHTVLSIFPALLALVSLLGVVGQAESTVKMIMGMIEGVASPQVADTLRQPIEQLATAPSAGLALIVGLLGALWTASGYVGAFGRAMNRIYEVDEGRPFYKLRPLMLLVTLVMLLLAVAMAILLIVSGPIARTIGDAVGLGETAVMVWNIAKWPVLVVFAILLIAVLYYGTPNVKQPKFRWLSLGSVLALVILAIATLGFFFYVSNFGHYNKTYGAIGGVIVMLLWIWIANLSLLLGAEFDAEMERGRELQGGLHAAEDVQLPPRDTKASDKRSLKEERIIEEGRALRQASRDGDRDS